MSQPEYHDQYHRLDSVPKALFLIEAECLDTPTDTTAHNEFRQKAIVFGLGMLTILLIIGGFQLSRSQDVTPGTSEVEVFSDR